LAPELQTAELPVAQRVPQGAFHRRRKPPHLPRMMQRFLSHEPLPRPLPQGEGRRKARGSQENRLVGRTTTSPLHLRDGSRAILQTGPKTCQR
jgi:hypothetical protein